MFDNIRKVGAGTYLTFSSETCGEKQYWDPINTALPVDSTSVLVDQLESLLSNAVQKQIRADVPVGVFTSGGIDSSLLAALASHHSGPYDVNTFSVGFAEAQFDETPYAERLASHLGTNHRSVVVDREALGAALNVIVDRVAEPSADPAILPTYLLSLKASDAVKVVLGGEGADELFGGYPTYVGHRLAPGYRRLPAVLRRTIERIAQTMPISLYSKVSLEYLVRRFLTGVYSPPSERHLLWFGTGAGPRVLNPDLSNREYDTLSLPDAGDEITAACLFDYCTYLRENLLTKVDRATMLTSIEARAPYLDRDVSSFALSLDSHHRLKGLTTKWLLKQVARRWIPRQFVNRKKRGLSVPVAAWMNGELKPEVDRL
jgi:asparagine synthase (glutamine-hydrolysing)